MKKVSASALSIRDLATVAGGLNEFAHRTDLGDSAVMNHGLSLGVLGSSGPGIGTGIGAGPGGIGGVSAGGVGGIHDMLGLIHGPAGNPGAGAAYGGGGGTGAGAGNGTGGGVFGTGTGGTHGVINPALIHAWDSAPGAHGAGGSVPGGISAGSAPGAYGPGGMTNGIMPNGVPNGLFPNGSTPGGFPGVGTAGTGAGPHLGWNDAHMNSPLGGPNGVGVGSAYSPLGGASGFGPNGVGVGNANMAGGQYGIATQSFEIRNWGDPHINISINGQDMGQFDEMASVNNFQVFHNTVGGATSISTDTTDGGGATYNERIDIQGGQWGLSVGNADMDGDVDAVIKDAYGTHEIAVGQSIREMDGTTITNTGDKLIVEQRLADGGHVTTEIEINGANYLDMKSTGQGNAGLGGYVVDKFDDQHQVQQNVGPAQTTTNPLNTVGWG